MQKDKSTSRFGSDHVTPRYLKRHDNDERKQAFSKNFGEFMENKNAFVTQRQSKGALSVNGRDAPFKSSV
jgi:hypothetical protein